MHHGPSRSVVVPPGLNGLEFRLNSIFLTNDPRILRFRQWPNIMSALVKFSYLRSSILRVRSMYSWQRNGKWPHCANVHVFCLCGIFYKSVHLHCIINTATTFQSYICWNILSFWNDCVRPVTGKNECVRRSLNHSANSKIAASEERFCFQIILKKADRKKRLFGQHYTCTGLRLNSTRCHVLRAVSVASVLEVDSILWSENWTGLIRSFFLYLFMCGPISCNEL